MLIFASWTNALSVRNTHYLLLTMYCTNCCSQPYLVALMLDPDDHWMIPLNKESSKYTTSLTPSRWYLDWQTCTQWPVVDRLWWSLPCQVGRPTIICSRWLTRSFRNCWPLYPRNPSMILGPSGNSGWLLRHTGVVATQPHFCAMHPRLYLFTIVGIFHPIFPASSVVTVKSTLETLILSYPQYQLY